MLESSALAGPHGDEPVTETYVTPNGGHAWWTGSADDLNTTLTRTLDLTGIKSATVTAKSWYDIEAGYDYLYAEWAPSGTDQWTQIGSPISTSSKDKWNSLRFSVPGNGKVDFRFRYQTDGGVHYAGAFIDDVVIKNGGTTLFSDDVEGADANGWTAKGGFKKSDGTEVSSGE